MESPGDIGVVPFVVTGASFVVFNGALKQSSGLRAKSSIVEDGLMVQITAESLAALKAALKDMQDYDIGCGPLEASEPDERVRVQWVEEDRRVNVGSVLVHLRVYLRGAQWMLSCGLCLQGAESCGWHEFGGSGQHPDPQRHGLCR